MKLKPVPEEFDLSDAEGAIYDLNRLLNHNPTPLGEVGIRTGIKLIETRQKQNEIISYLDYLREHIQNLEDAKHG